jgi:aminoglycoside phosphotransferase (APT) family kinase protein
MSDPTAALDEAASSPPTSPNVAARDLRRVRERIEAWLAGQLPAGADPEVTDLDASANNGLSAETLLFDATWREDGVTRTESLVAKLPPNPGAMPVFPTYDFDRQVRVMRLVRQMGAVPVPSVLWLERDPSHLGTPFYVMERVDGEVPPDVPPYNVDSWLTRASHDDQVRLQQATVQVLADLHGIERPTEVFAFLQTGEGDTALLRHFAETRAYNEWIVSHDGVRSSVIDRTLAWLEDNWPPAEGPTVLSWGDARIGNILYRDLEPVAVIDWEMVGLATPEVDLSYFIFVHQLFEDLVTRAGHRGMPDFLRADDVVSEYARVSGYEPRHLDWHRRYAAVRVACTGARVLRRSIRASGAALPDNIDDALPHARLLEELLS